MPGDGRRRRGALTIHKAQDKTTEIGLLLGTDDIDAQAAAGRHEPGEGGQPALRDPSLSSAIELLDAVVGPSRSAARRQMKMPPEALHEAVPAEPQMATLPARVLTRN